MRRQGLVGMLIALAWVEAASAQDVKPTVAPAPLELRRKPTAIKADDQDRLLVEFERLVRAAGARVPTPSEMGAALEQLKRQDFSASDEALAQLAQKAQTLYGVHVQVDYPVTGTIVAVGKVVRADGKRVGEEVRIERSREMRTYVQATTEAVIAVLEKLDLQRLPSSLTVAEAAPVKQPDAPKIERPIEPPPPFPPLVIETPGPSKGRIVSYALGGGGLIVTAIGAGLLISASIDKSALNVNSGIVGVPFTEDAAARARGANSASRTGGGMLGLGVAVLAAAGAVFFLAPDTDEDVSAPAITLMPTPNGAFVGLTVEVP